MTSRNPEPGPYLTLRVASISLAFIMTSHRSAWRRGRDRGVRATHVASDTQLLDPASSARTGYERRIAQLRAFAEEDGIELSARSEGDFFDFACTEPRTRAASLVLLDNGNLRAVWRAGEREVGVQFHGGGSVQYLISREGDDGKITHRARRGTFEEFSAAIEGAGLGGLLYE